MNPSQSTALDRVNDAAKVGAIFVQHFLPQLHHLSQQTQTEAQMVPFLKSGQAALNAGLDLLETERQRGIYQNLCQRHLHEELTRLSVRAARQNQQNWRQINEKLMEAQLNDVKRWPEDERHFGNCIQNGMSALQAYHRQINSTEAALEAAQARFLSDLLVARLQALAPVNIAYAAEVYNRHQKWLTPSQKNQIQGFLNRMEQIVRAGLLADAISKIGPKENWLSKVPAVAAHESDNDARFRALLLDAVQARVEEAESQELIQRQTETNAMLRAILTQHAKRLDLFLAQTPELAPAWDRADEQTHSGLLELMRQHRREAHFTPNEEKSPIWTLAIGQALNGKGQFYTANLATSHWNALPARQRLILIELQDRRCDPTVQAELSHNAATLRQLNQPPIRNGGNTPNRTETLV